MKVTVSIQEGVSFTWDTSLSGLFSWLLANLGIHEKAIVSWSGIKREYYYRKTNQHLYTLDWRRVK